MRPRPSPLRERADAARGGGGATASAAPPVATPALADAAVPTPACEGWRALPVLAVVLAALAASVVLSFLVGAYPVPPDRLFHALASGLGLAPADAAPVPPAVEAVVWRIRGPRVLAAAGVGAALAVAGAAYQSLFRNPLVSPDILGVSSGTALGAVTGIFLGLSVLGIQALAFAGGVVAVAAVYALAAGVRGVAGTEAGGRDPALVLVLGGVVVGSLLGSGVALLKALADPYNQLPAIAFWLLGSLASTDGGDARALWVALPLGLAPLLLLRWRLDAMTLGDEEARALGVEVRAVRLAVVGGATLVTAAAVAVAGVVGWVGLVVPHAARLLVGPSAARLLPTAAALGATYLLLVDTLARSLGPVEVPLGVLTAALGTPAFLWLLARGRGGGWS